MKAQVRVGYFSNNLVLAINRDVTRLSGKVIDTNMEDYLPSNVMTC